VLAQMLAHGEARLATANHNRIYMFSCQIMPHCALPRRKEDALRSI